MVLLNLMMSVEILMDKIFKIEKDKYVSKDRPDVVLYGLVWYYSDDWYDADVVVIDDDKELIEFLYNKCVSVINEPYDKACEMLDGYRRQYDEYKAKKA